MDTLKQWNSSHHQAAVHLSVVLRPRLVRNGLLMRQTHVPFTNL
jgi:hypothetical protein